MYEELIKDLRYCVDGDAECAGCKRYGQMCCEVDLMEEAADAIEKLEVTLLLMKKTAEFVAEKVPQWIRFETRPMDEEERREYSEIFGYELTEDEAVIYCCQLPEDGQEVLVCTKGGNVYIDTFENDPDYGVSFETNGDMDGLVAWMPLPEPPKE